MSRRDGCGACAVAAAARWRGGWRTGVSAGTPSWRGGWRTGVLAAALAVLAGWAPGPASAAPPSPPAISAPEAILVEPDTGAVLYARQPHARRPVASTTKLMTALLVLERVPLDEVFTARGYHGIAVESTLGLQDGERMKVRDLLRALLLPSANDAAETLAQNAAGSPEAFVALMNRRARELGLRDTHYANPIGLDDPDNYSSAADLATLAARLRRFPFFGRTVAEPRAALTSGREPRVVDNRNDLVGSQPFVDGVKTGHTQGAGYVLVGSATRRGVSVISAVLADPSEASRDADTIALLDYGLRQVRRVTVVRPGRAVASAAIRHRDGQRVALEPMRPVTQVVRYGQRTTTSVEAPRELDGPLAAGSPAGAVVVRIDGRPVARVGLVTARAVPAPPLGARIGDALRRPATLALVTLAAGAAALALTGRRRRARDQGSRAGTA